MAQFGGSWMSNPQMGSWNQYLQQYASAPFNNPYTPGSVDPTNAINSAKPLIQSQMNQNFATAAGRLGRPSTANSSPYQTAFGRVAQDASNQFANTTYNYLYDASKFNAGQNQDWAKTVYNAGANAAGQQSAQDYGAWSLQTELGDKNMSDWWQRYYNWYLAGGSPENMQQWQNKGLPMFDQYRSQF